MNFDLRTIALYLIVLILSLTVHEWAHAFTARRLGDDTAERQGRLTLNPLSHIDPFGTLLFPLIGIAMGGMIFGWARPVPFTARNFTRKISMRTSISLVAAAGPFSNLVLALLMAGALKLCLIGGVFTDMNPSKEAILAMLGVGIQLNVLLMFFNLIPFPPLDGSKILVGVLPRSADGFLERLESLGFFGLLIAIFVLIYPISWATMWLVSIIRVGFGIV